MRVKVFEKIFKIDMSHWVLCVENIILRCKLVSFTTVASFLGHVLPVVSKNVANFAIRMVVGSHTYTYLYTYE